MSEFLQIAQVLADLSLLQNTDPTAAHALLTANKSISPQDIRRKSQQASLPEQPRFDKWGRRIIRGPAALSRANSSFTGTSTGTNSGVATPVGESNEDIDLTRAKKLLELYEMRGKLQEMGDTGLGRAKERVDRVVDQYAKKDLAEREKVARSRHLGV